MKTIENYEKDIQSKREKLIKITREIQEEAEKNGLTQEIVDEILEEYYNLPQVKIDLSEEQLNSLKEEAKRKNIMLEALVNKILEEYLEGDSFK